MFSGRLGKSGDTSKGRAGRTPIFGEGLNYSDMRTRIVVGSRLVEPFKLFPTHRREREVLIGQQGSIGALNPLK